MSARTWAIIAIQTFGAFCLAACGSGENRNLWHRDFGKIQSRTGVITRPELTGYWEGDIAMGSVRVKIESDKIILTIRCDDEGKLVAQGSAPISVKQGPPSAMILQNDLQSDAGDVCGFRFYKGNEFAFALEHGGLLKITTHA